MVQGLPAVKWTPENNNKLLATIVTLYSGAINTKQIAAVFGPHVPPAAINYRLNTLRKEGAALGIALDGSGAGVGVPKTSKRAPAVRNNKTTNKNGKAGKRAGGVLTDDPTDDESADLKEETDEEQNVTSPTTESGEQRDKAIKDTKQRQKTIGGRITKARVSPRKSAKKDYKALEDPFEALKGTTDGDGEEVFNTDKSDGEDSFASDAEYMKGAQQATIKMEEAI